MSTLFESLGIEDFSAPNANQSAAQEPTRSMPRAIADFGVNIGKGAVTGVRMLADTFGADNEVSGGLRTLENAIGEFASAKSQRDQRRMGEIMAEAEGKGWGAEFAAAIKAAGAAPDALIGQAIGTMVPTVAASVIPGALPARLAAAGIGGAMGVGSAKGSIYEAEKRHWLDRGANEVEANYLATDAQSYQGSNAANIAISGGLGVIAGSSGAEKLARGLVRGASRDVVDGVGKRVLKGAAGEAMPEAAQGGFEKYTTNSALINDGANLDPMAGVVGNATLEAAASVPMGGALAIPKPKGPLSRGANVVAADASAPIAPSVDLPPASNTVAPAVPPVEQPAAKEEPQSRQQTEEGAEFVDVPFGDRIITLNEQLQDPSVREKVRARWGDSGLNDITYYSGVANRTDIPEKTSEKMIDLAESMLARAIAPEVNSPVQVGGMTRDPITIAQGQPEAQVGRIGLDTTPSGRFTVDAGGNVATETTTQRSEALRRGQEIESLGQQQGKRSAPEAPPTPIISTLTGANTINLLGGKVDPLAGVVSERRTASESEKQRNLEEAQRRFEVARSGTLLKVPETSINQRPLSVERGMELVYAKANGRTLLPQEDGFLTMLRKEMGDDAYAKMAHVGKAPFMFKKQERTAILKPNQDAIAEWDAANNPTGNVDSHQAGDVLNPSGKPFKTKIAAEIAAKKTPGFVVPVVGGYVVRPDGGWKKFPKETGTLGVPRAEMPQVKNEHRGAMVNFLNARGVGHEAVEVDAAQLKPTQAEFSPEKVEKAKNEDGKRSILISSDGHIIDGHHQALAHAQKGEPVKAIKLDAPAAELIPLVNEFPSSATDTASAAAVGNREPFTVGAGSDFPASGESAVVLQNRDRTTAASIAQMNDIAASPDYIRVGPSREMSTGAPVVFGDMPSSAVVGRNETVVDGRGERIQVSYAVAEANDLISSNQADGTPVSEYASGVPGKLRSVAGNGRTAGLKAAYGRNTASQYRNELEADASSIGVDPESIRRMSQPVLVRVMRSEDVTNDMGDRTNISGTQSLSPVEQAANDVRRVDLTAMAFNPNGEPSDEAVRGFVQAMPVGERGGLLNANGSPTRQAIDRFMAATFKQAYESDELVQLYAQATDTEAKAVMSALADAAGAMSSLKGAGALDIRKAVADAAMMAVNAARQGQKLSDTVKNADLDFGPEVFVVAKFLSENIRSAKKMGEGLMNWAAFAGQQAQIARDNENQSGFFGDQPTITRDQLFQKIGNDNQSDANAGWLGNAPGRAERQTADTRADEAGSAGRSGGKSDEGQQSGLTSPTRADIEAQQARAEQAQRQADADRRKAEEDDRVRRERADIAQASVAAADSFELGQDPMQNLTGQKDIFASESERATDTNAQVVAQQPTKTTPADVDRSAAEAKKAISLAIDAMTAQQAQKIASRFFPSMGLPKVIGKKAIKATITDKRLNLQAAADEFGVELSAEVKAALLADFEGRVSADDSLVDGVQKERETIEPAKDKKIGVNDAGELLYERANGSRYRMHAGKPDFGGDLVPADGDAVKPTSSAQNGRAPAKPVADSFGEKLPPARRAMAAKLSEELSRDKIASMSLSQIWPLAENAAIEDTFAAAVAHVMREAVPPKPRTEYKLTSWVGKVQMLRNFAAQILGNRVTKEKFVAETEKLSSLRDMLSKIKLLEQIDRAAWGRIGDVSEAPGAIRYEDGKPIPQPSVSVSVDGKNHWMRGSGDINTHISAIKALLEADAPVSKIQFEVWTERGGERKSFITKKGDREARRLMEFSTAAEAKQALKDRYADFVTAWENVKSTDNITERDLRSDTNRERSGKNHRNGRDVTAEEFESAFGFRGGEFGKWVQQGAGAKERQFMLNSAYDALMDLADIVGVPPKAISLEGTLGIAFGSRGSGWASAHFEPSNLVINLTKTRGAGSLAHEWFHALDNYFARKRGGEVPIRPGLNAQKEYRLNNYITHKTTPMMVRKDRQNGSKLTMERLESWRKSSPNSKYLDEAQWIPDPMHKAGVRVEVEQRFDDLVTALNKSPMLNRARRLDGVKEDGDGYWSRTLEMAARAFENYVQNRMLADGYHNDFLVNVKSAPDVGKAQDRYPYLMPSEVAPIADAFTSLFEAVQTKETESGNVAMFSRGNTDSGLSPDQAQQITDEIKVRWSNAPDVVVVADMQDAKVPKVVRDYDAQQRSLGASGDPEGFWYGGKAYIVAGSVNSGKDVARVLFHEVLGHYGLRGVFGDQLAPILKQIAALRRNQVEAKAKQYGLDMSDEKQLMHAAEEVLAEMAQTTPENGYVQRAIAAIRSFLRKHVPGFTSMKLTDAEIIRQYILPARRFVEGGGPNGGPGGGVRFSRSSDNAPVVGESSVSSAAGWRDMSIGAGYKLHDLMQSHGKLSWWDKTVGTQYNLAQKHDGFRSVFEAVQKFIGDASFYSAEAAANAPTVLPKLETWGDIFKSPLSAQDTKAISVPVFEGTLNYGRTTNGDLYKVSDLKKALSGKTELEQAEILVRLGIESEPAISKLKVMPDAKFKAAIAQVIEQRTMNAGAVFSDLELKSEFGLNQQQIVLYKEVRKAIDKSLESLAVSHMLKVGGKDVASLKDQAMGMGLAEAAKLLTDELATVAENKPNRSAALAQSAQAIQKVVAQTKSLSGNGYAPLSRFGKYTLEAKTADGEYHFSMHDSEADRNKAARLLEDDGATVQDKGTMSQEEFKLLNSISPESLALFGEILELNAEGESDSDVAYQAFLQKAIANQSAMKRMIHRKGTAGFSEDIGRVLAGFVYSNGRLTSSNLHKKDALDAARAISKSDGEAKDAAIQLIDYVQNPREELQAFRAFLFAQYLGGSVASALMNATQPVTMSLPYLSQFGGAYKAGKALSDAVQYANGKETDDAALNKALKHAEEEGIVSPQEIHQLLAQSMGKSQLKADNWTTADGLAAKASNTASKVAFAWGKVFGLAEQFNRRITFIAAYKIAVERGVDDPVTFAKKAVHETQGIYNKGNKPKWARGGIGSVLFTFKQFTIGYVEWLARMATAGKPGSDERKAGQYAVGVALGVLFLTAGIGGMPGADDMDDLIDGVMQRLGYNFSAKQAKREFLADLVGDAGADFVIGGITAIPGSPIDLSGRFGIGNIIPGTGALTVKSDYSRDIKELLGPGGDFASRVLSGANKLTKGDLTGAVTDVLPRAAANFVKGGEMWSRDMYLDASGKNVASVDFMDGTAKFFGFQPKIVKDAQQATGEVQRAKAFWNLTKSEIQEQIAAAKFAGDAEAERKVRERIADWNQKNPGQRITINMPAVIRRVRNMRMTKAQRTIASTPKALRAEVRSQLGEVR